MQALRWLILVEDTKNEYVYHSEVGGEGGVCRRSWGGLKERSRVRIKGGEKRTTSGVERFRAVRGGCRDVSE